MTPSQQTLTDRKMSRYLMAIAEYLIENGRATKTALQMACCANVMDYQTDKFAEALDAMIIAGTVSCDGDFYCAA